MCTTSVVSLLVYRVIQQMICPKYMNFFIRDPRAVGILSSERGVPGTKEMRDFLKPGYSREETIMVDYLENIESRTRNYHLFRQRGAGEISKAFTRYWEGVFWKNLVASAARSFYREAGRTDVSKDKSLSQLPGSGSCSK